MRSLRKAVLEQRGWRVPLRRCDLSCGAGGRKRIKGMHLDVPLDHATQQLVTPNRLPL